MALVSPGVEIQVTDESFFIPVSAPTVPLIFIATADEKLQTDGVTPAEGTFEHSRVRTITSLNQSVQTYGSPRFLRDANTLEEFHGDARNEYGLFALNQYLGIGNRAFVVRANVNLNDDFDDLQALWDSKMLDGKLIVANLASDFINEFNTANGLIVGSFNMIASQTELLYDGVGPNGSFVGGDANIATPYIAGETIELSNGAVITVGSVDGSGDVLTFSVTTIGSFVTPSVALIQVSTSGTGVAFTLTPEVANTIGFKTTLTGAEYLSIVNDGTSFIFDPILGSFSFIPVQSDFIDDQNAAPFDVFSSGFALPATGTYDGLTYVSANIGLFPTLPGGGTVAGEFTAQEAGDLLVALADDFKFTQNFLNKTNLGANDAARRVSIVTALQAAANSNTEIRSESFDYNLILAPGYPEVVDELLAIATDIKEEALVIGDVPGNLTPDGITNPTTGWAATTARQNSTNVAYYAMWCKASNLDGRDVVVAPSGTALRQYAFSDDVSFLWFAPAGVRRGVITSINDIGYVSGSLGGPTEFIPVALNQGQRDALYQDAPSGRVNPLVFFPGQGFLVWGQKTSAAQPSAMDRVNVSRLIKYIKRQLRRNTLSFVFEPNDQLTRDNLKAVVDNFLGDLIVKRGLFDFATISDTSNNTPDRIDRNEMYIDVALKPTKTGEFIFIPMKLVSSGVDI
jgi:hypothetical protein